MRKDQIAGLNWVLGYLTGFIVGMITIIHKCWLPYANNYTFIEYLKMWVVK